VQPLARNATILATGASTALSAAQVLALVQNSPALDVSSGVELLDVTLAVLADLTGSFEDGTVSRDSYATLHGTASLLLAQELDWGTAILRPYMSLSDGTTSARFNLGAYLTSSPETEMANQPIPHQIEGFDILHWLNTPVGGPYVVAAGTGYLAAAEAILLAQGIQAYTIDQTQAGQVLPSPKTWALDQNTTWLNVVNDLLAAVGYLGVWSDWDGRLRMTPYIPPTTRGPEWLYTTDQATSMLAPDRKVKRDYFQAPNRWVFYWSQDPSGAQPVEGAGIYTYVNQASGPTSVAARGRVITAPPLQVDAVDQASLVAQAQALIDADLRLGTTFEIGTAPNPLHWHFDRVTLADPAVGPLTECLVNKWTLPIKGGDMTHEWSQL
jgi:hypothetical protein